MIALAAFIAALVWLVVEVVAGGGIPWLPLVLMLMAAHMAFGHRVRGI